ncbi:hypothetical protein [Enterococcus casseliflavus]|nr:hypothetical protein [Enterococcus casseliflavus]
MKSINLTSKFDELIKVKENPFQTPPPYEKLTGLDLSQYLGHDL